MSGMIYLSMKQFMRNWKPRGKLMKFRNVSQLLFWMRMMSGMKRINCQFVSLLSRMNLKC
jgi:hypothetical protein